MARVACLLVPSFPLAARLRADPALAREPLVVLESSGKIAAATSTARAAGIRPGFSAAQARALLPAVQALARDAHAESAAREALLEAAESASPVVEDAGPGVVYLDVSGCDEKALLRALLRRCAALGLPARAGAGAGRVAARLAARLSADEPTIVRPGGDRGFLAPLPVAQLAPDETTARTLERWGVRTIGALAALPEAQLVARLGEPGWRLRRLAWGDDPRPLLPRRKPAVFREGLATDWGLTDLEQFMTAAQGLVERLTARLEASALSCRALTLTLSLEPSGVDERRVALPAPTRDARTLLGLIRLELSSRPPSAPISAFEAGAEPEAARQTQLSLFGPSAPSPDLLSAMLARLTALLGPDGVGSPKTVDGHKPERCALAPYAPPPSPELAGVEAPSLEGARPFCAARALRPAVPLEVIFGERASPPRPLELRAEGASLPISGRVAVASGPWRVEEGWWGEGRVRRDYWDVELSDGSVYRIYFDAESKAWFADGLYD